MGVPKLYKLFIEGIEGILEENNVEPYAALFDLNGFIHKCAGAVFGYGKTLYGTDIDYDSKEFIKQKLKKKDGFEQLKMQFLNSLGPALDTVIINLIRPTDILIITIDGMAPFAKGNQQRLRRNDSGFQRTTSEGDINTKFDTAFLTAGTPFMKEVSDTIRHWLTVNKSRLPHYTMFSGSDVPGEGEHKMFALLDEVKNYVLSTDRTVTKKNKEEIFRSQKFLVYGLDADLAILTMMRDYNFIWMREQYSISKLQPSVNIDSIRNYVVSAMKPHFIADVELTKEHKRRLINDFCLMSFLIGDDFVPAMFPLTINIKITLDKFMEKYAILCKDDFKFITDTDGNIVWQNFLPLLEEFIEVEREMYDFRREIDVYEHRLALNPDDSEAFEKVKEFRTLNKIKFNPNEKYLDSDILKLSYEDYIQKWKEILARPASVAHLKAQNHKIDYLLNVDHQLVENDNEDTCQDYLIGLQWNIKYYLGNKMGNWYYKKPFPPTIHGLCRFLKSGKFMIYNVLSHPTDVQITLTQMLVFVLNPHFSMDVLKSFFKTEKAYHTALINCSYINTMFPKRITYFFQGKYLSEEHTKIPLLPPVILDDILKVIKSRNEPEIGTFMSFLGREEVTLPRLLSSSIGFSRTDDVKIIPARPSARFSYREEHKSPTQVVLNKFSRDKISIGGRGRGDSGRGRGDSGRGRGDSGRGRGDSGRGRGDSGRGRGDSVKQSIPTKPLRFGVQPLKEISTRNNFDL